MPKTSQHMLSNRTPVLTVWPTSSVFDNGEDPDDTLVVECLDNESTHHVCNSSLNSVYMYVRA